MKRPGHSRRATFTAKERRDLLAYADWFRRDPPKLTMANLRRSMEIPPHVTRAVAIIDSASIEGYEAAHSLFGIDWDDIAESLAYDGTNGP